VKLGQHLVVRVDNHIYLDDPTYPDHTLPISVHLHGGHTPAHSDGHANFLVHPGEARDYYYPNGVPLHTTREGDRWTPTPGAWDLTEVPTTLWYHDHAIDITAHNALMGLAGMYLLSDAREEELRTNGTLPPVERDLPLALRDVCLMPVTEPTHQHPHVAAMGGAKEARIHFDPFDHDGALGDFVLVNGSFAPTVTLTRDTWRLRILNASLARFYNLKLIAVDSGIDVSAMVEVGWETPGVINEVTGQVEGRDMDVPSMAIRPDHVREVPFERIGKDTWMFEKAVRQTEAFLGMANRADLVVNLAEVPAGKTVYLVSTLDQRDGRGPGHGDNQTPNRLPEEGPAPGRGDAVDVPRHDDPSRWLWLMKIDLADLVAGGTRGTFIGTKPLRPHERTIEKISSAGLRFDAATAAGSIPTREFNFQRGKGAWQINGRFYDRTNANAVPALWGVERWILRNNSGGWWHPIHIHLESHQVVYADVRGVNGLRFVRVDPTYLNLGGLGKDARNPDEGPFPGVDLTAWSFDIKHDTAVLGPNTEVHILMQYRTFEGPFVFHCHNLNHEDMMMMNQFDPRKNQGPAFDQPVRDAYFFSCTPPHP
jgi:FtsP/CotA-like multicopper oxidase with cupredoxin domain